MNRAGWAGLTVAAISLLGVVDACFYAEPRERPADGGPTAADGAPDAPVADSASPGDAGAAPCPDEAGCTLPRVVQITAGASHTCARLADGSLRCWGYNDHGQLGNGDTTDRLNPTPVTGVTAAVDVATGGSHTCAVTRDGAALCWGANGGGSVGDGTFDDRPTPARVLALPRVAKLACGGHCCARDAAGAVWCWGTNQNGQLGDGTRTTRAVATPVLGRRRALPARHTHAARGARGRPQFAADDRRVERRRAHVCAARGRHAPGVGAAPARAHRRGPTRRASRPEQRRGARGRRQPHVRAVHGRHPPVLGPERLWPARRWHA